MRQRNQADKNETDQGRGRDVRCSSGEFHNAHPFALVEWFQFLKKYRITCTILRALNVFDFERETGHICLTNSLMLYGHQ
jgi:hypothetical protein